MISNNYLFNIQYDRKKCAVEERPECEMGFLGIAYQLSKWYKVNKRTKKYE